LKLLQKWPENGKKLNLKFLFSWLSNYTQIKVVNEIITHLNNLTRVVNLVISLEPLGRDI
jgi:hypothetical protein